MHTHLLRAATHACTARGGCSPPSQARLRSTRLSARCCRRLVSRAHCDRGCEGPVLRPNRRFGRRGRQLAGSAGSAASPEGEADGNMKVRMHASGQAGQAASQRQPGTSAPGALGGPEMPPPAGVLPSGPTHRHTLGACLALTRPAPQDHRHMYLSLDEACTHVSASAFRLVAALYDPPPKPPAGCPAGGEPTGPHGRLLGAAVSPPIK